MCIIACFALFRSEKWYDYILAGIAFGITLYTYAISYLILPIFLLLLMIYMLYTKKITFKNMLFFGVPIFLLALPLIAMILVNNNILHEIKFFITIPKLPEYRGTEISVKHIKDNLLFMKTILTHDDFPYNATEKYGTMYYFGAVLSVLGIVIEFYYLVQSIRKKKFSIHSAILLLFLSVFGCMLVIKDPNINRANAIYFPLIFFCYTTIKFIYKKFEIISLAIILIYVVWFSSFIEYYFTSFENNYKDLPYFEQDLITAIEQVNGREELKDKKVCIWTLSAQPYIYTLFANPISPYEFNETREYNDSYGRFVFNSFLVDDNMAYIIKDNSDIVWELTENQGFCAEEIGNYVLLYK